MHGCIGGGTCRACTMPESPSWKTTPHAHRAADYQIPTAVSDYAAAVTQILNFPLIFRGYAVLPSSRQRIGKIKLSIHGCF